MSVWERLRHHKVAQWTLAYAAGAYTVLHAVEMVSGALGWPHFVVRIATLVLLLGLPVVVTLAWFHGHRARQRVSSSELVILTGLFVISGGVLWVLGNPDHGEGAGSVTRTGSAEGGVEAMSPPMAPEKSIAVLPFVNMSSDPDQEYFSDGISEELLNLLAKIPQLRVISRSSAFSYKGKDVKLAQIAEELNVAHILEGSVRKAGNKVRIAAQLIDARSDTHLWSHTWDRELGDIFAVQDEIAAAVVGQLKVTLLGEAPKAEAVNPEAYALFMQGRQQGRQGTAEGLEQAVTLYQQALALDPGYAAAWDGLATVYANQVGFGLRPGEEGVRLAREAVAKALAIEPDFAPAYSRLGWIAMFFDGDLGAAARHYAHALALEPASTTVIGNAAALASILSRPDTAIALHEYATARDPVNPVRHFNLGLDYLYAGRLDEAIASFRSALRLSPGYASAHFAIGKAMLQQGEAQAALAEMQQESDEVWRLLGLTMVYHTLGRKAESDAALAATIAKYAADWAYNIAEVLAWRNEPDRAFEWLDKAVTQQDAGLSETAINPLFSSLHDDSRWLPFLRKVGKAPEQLAAIEFDVTLPQ